MELNGDESVRNQMSMSTQEKLLMHDDLLLMDDENSMMDLKKETTYSTIKQIAKDFITLYHLEKSGML
jgi:hypothetical protein